MAAPFGLSGTERLTSFSSLPASPVHVGLAGELATQSSTGPSVARGKRWENLDMSQPIQERRRQAAEASLQRAYQALAARVTASTAKAASGHRFPKAAAEDAVFRIIVANGEGHRSDPRGEVRMDELVYVRTSLAARPSARVGGRLRRQTQRAKLPPSYVR